MNKAAKLRCLVCGKAIKSDSLYVYDAVLFRASGNYGSRIHDSNNTTIEAAVHDACVLRCATRMRGFVQPLPQPVPRIFMTTKQALKGTP